MISFIGNDQDRQDHRDGRWMDSCQGLEAQGHEEGLLMGMRFLFGDENVLKLGNGDGDTTL